MGSAAASCNRAFAALGRAFGRAKEWTEDAAARGATEVRRSRYSAAAATVGALGAAIEVSVGPALAPFFSAGFDAAVAGIATKAACAVARERGLPEQAVLAWTVSRVEADGLCRPYGAEVWRAALGLPRQDVGLAVRALGGDLLKGLGAATLAGIGAKTLARGVVPWVGVAFGVLRATSRSVQHVRMVLRATHHARTMPFPGRLELVRLRPAAAIGATQKRRPLRLVASNARLVA